ncbi:MAG: hypothetical protein AAGC60_16200 [Acidobacteriota bacterium]
MSDSELPVPRFVSGRARPSTWQYAARAIAGAWLALVAVFGGSAAAASEPTTDSASAPSAATAGSETVALGPPEPPRRTIDGAELLPRFALGSDAAAGRRAPRSAPMIFAVGDEVPVILRRENGEWTLRRVGLVGVWEFVGGFDDEQLWAVLDTRWQNSWQPLELIRSTDGGRSWSLAGRVEKPSNWARFEGLRMASSGSGRLTFAMPENVYETVAEGVAPGVFHLRTEDFGATWSEPVFEPNDLRPAEDTARHIRASWDPSVHGHDLWRDYLASVPPEPRGVFEGVTWSDSGTEIEVVIHTDTPLDSSSWRHESLDDPPRELVRIEGLRPRDAQVLPVGGSLVDTIRVGFHRRDGVDGVHVVLDLASSTAFVRSIEVLGASDLRLVVRLR